MEQDDESEVRIGGFEWDDRKRFRNIEKHQIDFVDAAEVFYGIRFDTASSYEGEARRQTTGPLGEDLITIIYTMRGNVIRIISARRARKNETRSYRELHDRRDS